LKSDGNKRAFSATYIDREIPGVRLSDLSDHLTQNQIESYGRRPLPAPEWLLVSDHLGVCEACCQKVEESLDNEAVYFALRSGVFAEVEAPPTAERAHLSFDQLAAIAEERLANEELQTAKDHLSWCQECKTAVYDLRYFKDQVAA
jgi:hypothetical protein